MAEALGVVGSIIAVIQITGTVVQYLHDVKHASKDTNRLLEEIGSTSGLLYALKDLISAADSKNAWASTCRSLDAPEGPLAHFKAALERLEKKLSPRGTVDRAAKVLIWPFTKSDVAEILSSIERQKTLFILALQNDHIKLSQEIHNDVQAVADAVRSLQISHQVQEDRSRDAESLEILQWLSPLNFWTQHADISHRREQGTGEWLLRRKKFQAWLEATNDTLWCLGMPGAGKTVISSLVIDTLLERAMQDDIGVAFVYCNYKHRGYTATDVVASILKQILQRRSHVPPDVIRLHTDFVRLQTRPPLAECMALLQAEAKHFSKVFIVIDALDEFSPDSKVLQDFLRTLESLSSYFNILITSRYISDVDDGFMGARIDIRADENDLDAYIRARTEEHSQLMRWQGKDSLFLDTLVNTIVTKADGMFLLAQLHLEAVAKEDNLRDARRALQSLPKELNETYDEALARIRSQDERKIKRAMEVLMWILHAERPLHVKEMQHALAVEPDDTDLDEEALPDEDVLVLVCCGLVTIDNEGQIIRLVHYTAEVYLKRASTSLFPDAHLKITRACLTYISFAPFDSGYCKNDSDFELRMQRFSFLRYAAENWGNHARQAPELAVSAQVQEFFSQDSKMDAFGQIKTMIRSKKPGYSQMPPKNMPGLSAAALFNLQDITKLLLKNGADVNAGNTYDQTALHVVARTGEEDMAALLLQADSVDVNIRDKAGWTPLFFAAMEGNEAVTRLLLNRPDIEINARDLLGRVPLFYTIVRGKHAVTKLLIEREDLDINASDGSGITPLLHAARSGEIASLKLLLTRKDIDIEFGGGSLWNMTYVVKHGWVDVLGLLLAREDGQADHKDRHGRTPLSHAAHRSQLEIAKVLTARDDVDINSKDSNGLMPLSYAILARNYELAVFLVQDCGADFRLEDSFGRSTLHLAAQSGNLSLFDYLLDLGLSTTSTDKAGNTLLHYAACGLFEPIARISSAMTARVLSLCGPDVVLSPAWTPLHLACRIGGPEAVKMLLEDPRVPYSTVATVDPPGSWTPLDIAKIHQNNRLCFRAGFTSEDPAFEAVLIERDKKAKEEERKQRAAGEGKPSVDDDDDDYHLAPFASKYEGYLCDLCSHHIYGPRYFCTVCFDFDFCFMCRLTAELTHPVHEMVAVMPGAESGA